MPLLLTSRPAPCAPHECVHQPCGASRVRVHTAQPYINKLSRLHSMQVVALHCALTCGSSGSGYPACVTFVCRLSAAYKYRYSRCAAMTAAPPSAARPSATARAALLDVTVEDQAAVGAAEAKRVGHDAIDLAVVARGEDLEPLRLGHWRLAVGRLRKVTVSDHEQ